MPVATDDIREILTATHELQQLVREQQAVSKQLNRLASAERHLASRLDDLERSDLASTARQVAGLLEGLVGRTIELQASAIGELTAAIESLKR
jgi:hypothetical protein